jgi:uncharacterized protein
LRSPTNESYHGRSEASDLREYGGVPKSKVGSVVSLWRYPVKSMMGEELDTADLTDRGLLGDRAYALMDSDGKVASAKSSRKWARLLGFRAALMEPPHAGEKIPPVRITLPDGMTVGDEQSNLDRILSGVIGREVTLSTTTPGTPVLRYEYDRPDVDSLNHAGKASEHPVLEGTFFDAAVVHVLTTATIGRFRELYPRDRFEERRFRPNVIVETSRGEKGFVENDWVGHTLTIGEEVRLSVTGPCLRCVMVNLSQGGLTNDPGILRTAVRHNEGGAGVYAAVLRGGTIRRGDPVELD